MNTKYVPRLSIDLTQEQHDQLNKIICQHGLKKLVFTCIIDDFISLCNKHGAGEIIGALTSKVIGINEICNLVMKDKNDYN